MSRFKARQRDKNRFTKKYPFVRAPKRFVLMTEGRINIELGRLIFNNESEKTLVFEVPFDNENYSIVAVPRNTTNDDSAQVSIFVDAATASASQVTVHASSNFTGEVDVVAIKVDK